MASDKILLHEPQWTNEDIKWYISSRPVKRILGKSGSAPAGTIFQVDYEYSKLDEKQKEIVLKSCHKGTWKVKWAPRTFYVLDDDSKNLLLALPDANDRLRFYLASRQSLEYGKTLKRGDDVCVRLPKRKELLVGGVIKYIGPVEVESSAIGLWFGVELMGSQYGDTDGVFKKTGNRYFTCKQGRGIFVTIKNLIPLSLSIKEDTQKLSANFKVDGDAPGRSSDAANNVGLCDIPQTAYIKAGDEVTSHTQMERGGQPNLQKFLREVEDLPGQLENMKTKYADTEISLMESQRMMLTFKSKNAELEAELHHTKVNLTSQLEEVERLKKEVEDGKKQTRLGIEEEKFLREVEDLHGQLENMKTKYADTEISLMESQRMMLTFKSKNAELEAELHHTKVNLTSQQEEVERLKKELEDGKKQTRLGIEKEEGSTEGYSGGASSPVGMRESRSLEDFGKFQFHLSSYLTRDIIRDLTLVLAFSPTESEKAEDDTYKFIRLLSGKGLISPTDITPLTNALYEIGQHGVLNAVKNLFDRNPSEAFR